MAYIKEEDFAQIQADVVTIDVNNNSKISKMKQLKTPNGVITAAINYLNQQLMSAAEGANKAQKEITSMADTLETKITETLSKAVESGIISNKGGMLQNDEFDVAEDQVEFTLSKTPLDKENILFYVNGVKYLRSDFAYDEAKNAVTWIGVKSDSNVHGFNLATTDKVSVVYMA